MGTIVNVSIIIVNYNTLHVLLPCIDSIVEQTKDIEIPETVEQPEKKEVTDGDWFF